MAEGSEKREHEGVEARRRQRADWFGKSLGDDWVEIEPGIYQHLLHAIQTKGRYVGQNFIHTVHKDGQWVNQVEGGSTFGGTYGTKEEAVAAGRERAREDKTEHVIHNSDGTIGERNSYGHDPASRQG